MSVSDFVFLVNFLSLGCHFLAINWPVFACVFFRKIVTAGKFSSPWHKENKKRPKSLENLQWKKVFSRVKPKCPILLSNIFFIKSLLEVIQTGHKTTTTTTRNWALFDQAFHSSYFSFLSGAKPHFNQTWSDTKNTFFLRFGTHEFRSRICEKEDNLTNFWW